MLVSSMFQKTKYSKVIPVNDVKQVALPRIILDEFSFHVIGFVCALEGCAGVSGDSLLVNDEFNDGAFECLG